jgi:HSP20 family protein
MAIVPFESVERLTRLQQDLDRFFGKPQFDLGLSGPNVFPLVNVFSDEDGLVVQAEVPGVQPDQLNVQVDPGRLTISGERDLDAGKDGSFHRRERRGGRFSRVIQLPRDLDPEQADAQYRNGLLTVRLPKSSRCGPRDDQRLHRRIANERTTRAHAT